MDKMRELANAIVETFEEVLIGTMSRSPAQKMTSGSRATPHGCMA